MSTQFRKNALIFFGALILRMLLVAIEVFFDFTGIALHAVYAISILSLFVVIWLVNRPLVAKHKGKALQLVSCSAIALLLTGLYVYLTLIEGTFFKFLIAGSM
ncbi:MAG: hypothetical protein K8S15_10950 [Candidatus Aegiribacteria sp.]|nr:hypothetical protein [Candidatus Aegiribacteria sp.]